MIPTVDALTPDEAFAKLREALDAHEAILPAFAGRADPVFAETHKLVITLMRAQVDACEAIVLLSPEAEAAFGAGYTTGMLQQAITSATADLSEILAPRELVTP